MDRRRFLAAFATGSVLGTAGCLGYTVQEQDRVDSRESKIDRLNSTVTAQQSTIDAQQSTIDAQQSTVDAQQSELTTRQQKIDDLKAEVETKESRISTLESNIDRKDGEIADLESDLATERRELVSTLYHLGDEHRQGGLNNWKDAAGLYDQGDFTGASNEWGLSAAQYFDAKNVFARAESVANEMGYADAATKISSSKNNVGESGKAANHFGLASYYYAHDNQSDGDSHIDKGNDALDNSDQYTLYEPKEIDSALGL